MTARPGGAADKAGNAYEHLWTTFRLAQVMAGEATSLTPEPIGPVGTGVEFVVRQSNDSWCEQVKDEASNWSRYRMQTEGILAVARTHLEAGRNFRFVISTSAEMMQTITNRARDTVTLTEFESDLGLKRLPEFAQIAQHWGVPKEQAYAWLKRLYIEQHPPEALRMLVQRTLSFLTEADPDLAIALLRTFVDDHIHQAITGAQLWSYFDSHGLKRRLVAGDLNVIHSLHRSRQALADRVDSSASTIHRVARPEVSEICTALGAQPRNRIHVCIGSAGSGKSTVASAVAEKMSQVGWEVAAVRMDVVDGGVQTAKLLGQANGLTDSPVVLLANLGPAQPTLLVVDQLDAVSLYGGRMPEAFASVVDLLGEARLAPSVHVLLVIREVDLARDSRLATLAEDDHAKKWLIGNLSEESVNQGLRSAGIDPRNVDSRTLSLLRVPLHLGIFGSLSTEARSLPYVSLMQLYEQFVTDHRIAVERNIGPFDWYGLTMGLVQYMSEHESTTAPIEVLDPYSPRAISALESQNVLVRDGRRIGFFHESFFDYLFARSFVRRGDTLTAFLDSHGQQLFRRAQVRQVLEYLEQADRPAFRRTVVELLGSTAIRNHIKDVALTVLRRVAPALEDWRLLEPLAWVDGFVGRQVRALLGIPAWFDAADALGRWEGWLAEETQLVKVFRELLTAAQSRPARVAALLRPYLRTSDDWDRRLAALAQWATTPTLVPFLIEVAETGALDEVRGPIAVNSDFWSIVYGLSTDDPASAASLIGAYLLRQQERAETMDQPDPFTANLIPRYSSAGGEEVVERTASRAPDAFADAVLPFVIRVAQRRPDAWQFRHKGDSGIEDAIFSATQLSLETLARSNTDAAKRHLQSVVGQAAEALRFLACRIYTFGDCPNEAVDWLLANDANLELGWMDSPNWATRELITAHTPRCDEQRFQALCARVWNFTTKWERRVSVEGLRVRGWTEYCLLTAFDQSRVGEAIQRRTSELRRKFEPHEPHPPRKVTFEESRSVISPEAAAKMRDEHWLGALKKYSQSLGADSTSPFRWELADLVQALAARARVEPVRFAHLAISFARELPPGALEEILIAVSGSLTDAQFTDLALTADQHLPRASRRQILRAVTDRTNYAAVPTPVVELLCSYADDPDPSPENGYVTEVDQRQEFDREFTRGLNSTRGALATTLASIVRRNRESRGHVLPTVSALAIDDSLAVRMCAADAVLALYDERSGEWTDLAEQCFHRGLEVVESPYAAQLLFNCLLVDPQRFLGTLFGCLRVPQAQSHGGELWALSALRDHFEAHATDLSTMDSPARAGAAGQFAKFPAESAAFLAALFNDTDPEVRRQAAMAVRTAPDLSDEVATPLLRAFIESPAFEDGTTILIHALAEPRTQLPTASLDACRRAIDLAGTELGDIRTSHAAMSPDLATVLLTIYKSEKSDAKKDALDEIDRLIEIGSYGLAEALNTETERL